MEEHLGYPKHDPEGRGSGNSRNGAVSKTVRGDFGQVEIEGPCDRNSSFDPKIVAKRQTSVGNFSEAWKRVADIASECGACAATNGRAAG
jgi:transposase-like protein